jgi:hypothetical protein
LAALNGTTWQVIANNDNGQMTFKQDKAGTWSGTFFGDPV